LYYYAVFYQDPPDSPWMEAVYESEDKEIARKMAEDHVGENPYFYVEQLDGSTITKLNESPQ